MNQRVLRNSHYKKRHHTRAFPHSQLELHWNDHRIVSAAHLHTCSQAWGCSHSCHCCRTWLCWAGELCPPTGSWVQLKAKQLDSGYSHEAWRCLPSLLTKWTAERRTLSGCWGLRCVLTQLAAGVPEGLRVEVGGVDAVRGRVDPGQLLLVEVDEGGGFLLHHLVGFGLAEWRHLPATVGCQRTRTRVSVRNFFCFF